MDSVTSDEIEKRLIKDLLNDYDRRLKPSINASHVLNVTFGLSLAQLIDVVRLFVSLKRPYVCKTSNN